MRLRRRGRPGGGAAMAWRIGAIVLAGLAIGCVGSSRSTGDYTKKAVATAEHVRSSVETVRVAVDAALDDRVFGPYLSEVTSQAEDDAASALDSLLVVQPPNGPSDRLREDADRVASAAIDLLAEARIAARRNDSESLRDLVEPLAVASEELSQFVEEHQ